MGPRDVLSRMLTRIVLVAVALGEVLFPKRFVDSWMSIAARNPEDVELRPWVYTVARVEGLVILLWVLTRGRTEEA
jgi:lipid-A-disaccharide synthase-like uncharacterized protein